MSINYEFTVSLPDILERDLEMSDVYENYTARGALTSFGIDMEFPPMRLHKTCKARDAHLLPGKIQDTLRVWEGKYQRHLDKLKKEKGL